MKRFKTVFPACGSSNSAIKLTCDELEEYSQCCKWLMFAKDGAKSDESLTANSGTNQG